MNNPYYGLLRLQVVPLFKLVDFPGIALNWNIQPQVLVTEMIIDTSSGEHRTCFSYRRSSTCFSIERIPPKRDTTISI